MTTAPPTLVAFQARMSKELGTTNLGIVGDQAHVEEGGYHIGATSLRKAGMFNDYSLEFPMDYNSKTDYACAADIGGSASLQMKLGTRIVKALKARDPRVYGYIRAVNAPFNGISIDRRYDCENPATPLDDNIQSNSDRNHIHVEWYRTVVNKSEIFDGIFDVFAGIPLVEGLVMDAEVKAAFDALNAKIDKTNATVTSIRKQFVASDAKVHKLETIVDHVVNKTPYPTK